MNSDYQKDTSLPFSREQAERLLAAYGSPLHVYDEIHLRETARRLNNAFDWAPGYRNYFAVKATPTPKILQLLHEEGMGFDCSSRAELEMVRRLSVPGEHIFFTSNNTPKEDFELAIELGATVNIDDLSQVPVFIEALGDRPYECVALRYNPGDLKSGNGIIGEPTEAKYGMSLDTLIQAYTQLRAVKISSFGLHTMVASNELNPDYFADTAHLLLDAVETVERKASITIDFINLGGGFGLNYAVDQAPLDVEDAAAKIKVAIQEHSKKDLRIFTENGRFVTGSAGFLLTRVRYVMQKHKTYVGVDASMQNLMRPGMYGAYHHITVLGKDANNKRESYDVVGSLCENNDKFAIDRQLPHVTPGDILAIHDSGAHGHSMGFNYNGLLRSAEVLLKVDGTSECIRKAETLEQYFQNVIWP